MDHDKAPAEVVSIAEAGEDWQPIMLDAWTRIGLQKAMDHLYYVVGVRPSRLADVTMEVSGEHFGYDLWELVRLPETDLAQAFESEANLRELAKAIAATIEEKVFVELSAMRQQREASGVDG